MASYEWKTDAAGNRRFIRTGPQPVFARLSESSKEAVAQKKAPTRRTTKKTDG